MSKPPADPTNADLAFQAIIALARVRERSSHEIRKRLAQKGFTEEASEEALRRAIASRFIDDRRFAEAYTRSKLAAGWGKARIVRDLRQQGIECDLDEDWFADALEAYPDEYTRARDFLLRRPPSSKNIQASAFRKLISHGFDSACAYQVSRDYAEEIKRESDMTGA